MRITYSQVQNTFVKFPTQRQTSQVSTQLTEANIAHSSICLDADGYTSIRYPKISISTSIFTTQ